MEDRRQGRERSLRWSRLSGGGLVALILVASLASFARAFGQSAAGSSSSNDRVAELVRQVFDARLSDPERQAAWSQIDTLLQGWIAAPEEIDDDRRRASIAAARFFIGCCRAGSWERRKTVDAANFALARARELTEGAEEEAQLALELSKLHILHGDTPAARTMLDASIAHRRAQRPPTLPWCLAQRGTVARLESRPIEALRWFDEARASLRPGEIANDRLLLPVICSEVAGMYLDLGLPDGAATWNARQKAAAQGIDNPVVQRGAELQEIRIDVAAGRSRAAIAKIERILAAEERAEKPFPGWAQIREQLTLSRGLAELDLRREDGAWLERAHASLSHCSASEALNRVERTEADLQLASIAIERRDFARANDAVARIEAGNALQERAGPRVETMQTARLAATRAWLARESAAMAEELAQRYLELRASWAAFLEFWRRTPLEEGGVGFLHYGHRRFILGQLIDLALAVEGPEAGAASGFQALLQAQAMGTLARRSALEPGSLDDVQSELLVPGEVLLAWLPAPSRSHLFIVDGAHLVHETLAPGEELQYAQRECLRELLARPGTDAQGRVAESARRASDAATARLAQRLLTAQAVAALRAARRVTVVGAELLGWTPLEALRIEDLGTLGCERAIAWLPSVPMGLELARRARARPQRAEDALELLALVGPQAGPIARDGEEAPAPIPFGETRARELEACYPQGRARIFDGASATRSCLRANASAGARVLYVLAHGAHASALARPAGLALTPEPELGDDGVLRCADVEGLWNARSSPCPELVVLAACGASRAPLRRGEDGVNHLGGAFLSAGALAVVLSPADLDLDATLALMRTFHERSGRADDPPSEALRRARSALAADARYAHSYYHAPLQVLGLGHRSTR